MRQSSKQLTSVAEHDSLIEYFGQEALTGQIVSFDRLSGVYFCVEDQLEPRLFLHSTLHFDSQSKYTIPDCCRPRGF